MKKFHTTLLGAICLSLLWTPNAATAQNLLEVEASEPGQSGCHKANRDWLEQINCG